MTNQLTDIDREAIAALRNQPMWIDLSYQERFERVFAAGIARERDRAAAPAGDADRAALIARCLEWGAGEWTWKSDTHHMPDRSPFWDLQEAAAALASAQRRIMELEDGLEMWRKLLPQAVAAETERCAQACDELAWTSVTGALIEIRKGPPSSN